MRLIKSHRCIQQKYAEGSGRTIHSKKKEKKKKYCFFTSQTYISSLTRLGLAMEKVHDPAPAKKTEKEGNDESESSQTTDGESRTEA